eukprot:1160831-Pelagomonas_calceolata.AAC.11
MKPNEVIEIELKHSPSPLLKCTVHMHHRSCQTSHLGLTVAHSWLIALHLSTVLRRKKSILPHWILDTSVPENGHHWKDEVLIPKRKVCAKCACVCIKIIYDIKVKSKHRPICSMLVQENCSIFTL